MYHPRSSLAPPPAHRDADASIDFVINPDLDTTALRNEYRRDGRVRIYGLLSQGAMELYDYIQASDDWIHVINTSGGVMELDRADKAALPADGWARIEEDALLRSREAFQYRYEAMRVPDKSAALAADHPLAQYARLMASGPMIRLLEDITGESVEGFTDGQATAYGPGDFLTAHDDAVEGKDRLAAYVFGLTPGWRLEWGGLLLFHGQQDRTAEALAPRFNTLDLFSVPQTHSVSLVSAAAMHRRYAITGWLRRSTLV
jgi:Rps23 Pro-64 3,4-dihydroxylase Tpa1-like proline 4-hydroxylase